MGFLIVELSYMCPDHGFTMELKCDENICLYTISRQLQKFTHTDSDTDIMYKVSNDLTQSTNRLMS